MGSEEILFTKADLRSVAEHQRLMCLLFFCFLILIVMALIAGLMQVPDDHLFFTCVDGVEICLRLAAMVLVYKLAASVKEPRPWMYVIGMFFPYLNLLVLAYLIPKATKVLRANNIRVGLMGYNKEDLNNYLSGNWEKK